MRLSVTYQVERVPLGYRMTVLSLLKEALKLANEAYYKELYEQRSKEMKPFSTAVFLKEFTYKEDEILLKELSITISSADMEFMLHLFNGLHQLRSYKTDGQEWKQLRIQMLKEAQVTGERVYFKTLSPILIENKQRKPIHPDEAEYGEEFSYYAALRIRELVGREPYYPIKIEPLNMKKTVIKETNSEFRELIKSNQKYLYFTAYRGTLLLTGHPDDLQFLYQSGVGLRASQSFGLLEYIREEA
ncbi:CRISPR-associated endoribonuclease Cas6 [Paenibacillus bouchesdurhonensis]|uniref:CRISPR-associated endoribonuclease Cas6 n=1 Tax=Paenibacillus bouchesdurhonensis TaxID=1870990 RepID=UPI000DA60A49|nr:CRISPR-associated endoribonuclease Cas6 [Paenibacillus bouchesdurhonensis]